MYAVTSLARLGRVRLGHRLFSEVSKTSITQELWHMRSDDQIVESASPSGYTRICYKFESDEALREEYMNPWGYMRHGKIFEDIDALAGTIAARHCADTTGNLHLVGRATLWVLFRDRYGAASFETQQMYVECCFPGDGICR